jgi:hypothetical protein
MFVTKFEDLIDYWLSEEDVFTNHGSVNWHIYIIRYCIRYCILPKQINMQVYDTSLVLLNPDPAICLVLLQAGNRRVNGAKIISHIQLAAFCAILNLVLASWTFFLHQHEQLRTASKSATAVAWINVNGSPAFLTLAPTTYIVEQHVRIWFIKLHIQKSAWLLVWALCT